jgi:hypothetical protein
MNKEEIVKDLIVKIKKIEQENLESDEAENKEVRGQVVNAILSELEKAVKTNEN